MHEAKLHRAKRLRVRGFETHVRLPARRRGILFEQFSTSGSLEATDFRALSTSGDLEGAFSIISRGQEAPQRRFRSIYRRPEAPQRRFSSIFRRPEGGFSSIFGVRRLRSEHLIAFSMILSVQRLRGEDFRGFSRRAAPAPPPKSPRRQRVTSNLLHRCLELRNNVFGG